MSAFQLVSLLSTYHLVNGYTSGRVKLAQLARQPEVELKVERKSDSLGFRLNLNLLRAGGIFNSLLVKSRKPPAGVVYIEINFCVAESNELPPVRP